MIKILNNVRRPTAPPRGSPVSTQTLINNFNSEIAKFPNDFKTYYNAKTKGKFEKAASETNPTSKP